MGRAPCCDKANVKRGPWSPEEDAKLKAYIEEHGTVSNWIALPHKIGIKRCGKSCRLRWLNYLRPNLKHGGFSEEEDTIICNLYISIGSRWSIIAAQLPGRTDNDIKNYWNTKLKKRLLGRPRGPSETRLQESTDDANSQALSSSALERMQLHIQLQGVHSPFSFYNHPLLWPKFYPLRGMINQSQSSNDNPTLIKPFREPELPNWINENIQDKIVNNSTPNALTSPSSSTDFSTRNSNSELDSVEAWLQGELQGSLYNESSCFVGVEDFRPSEFISFDDEGGSMNTLPTDYFEERSPLHSLASDRPAI